MDKELLLILLRLGFCFTRHSGVGTRRFAKEARNLLAVIYVGNAGASRAHVAEPMRPGVVLKKAYFDDPVSAAVWLNVELAGE